MANANVVPFVVGDRPARPGIVSIEIEETPSPVEDTLDNGDTLLTLPAASPPPVRRQFGENVAERMDPSALQTLAGFLLDAIDADLRARADWEQTANRAADFLGIKLEDPTTSVSADGTISKMVSIAMLESAVKLWGVGRAELLPTDGPVKVRVDRDPTPPTPPVPAGGLAGGAAPTGIAAPAADPGEQAEDLGQALATDLNHYLTQTDREYYPDFSRMLFHRDIIGTQFRKVYRCPLKRRPISRWVQAQNLILSNDTTHVGSGRRLTERIPMAQSTMRRMQVIGAYRDVPLVHPTGMPTETEIAIGDIEGVDPTPQLPEDYEHTVYECYTELGSGTGSSWIGTLGTLDLDENGRKPGFPLPYRISIDLDSREVLEIRRNWKQGDEDYTPRRRYVKYGFIPGFGAYDLGLIHLVGNPTLAATMVQRAATDGTLFANFPAFLGLQGPGTRNTQTVIRPNVGEITRIDGGGATAIKDAIMPMPYRQISGEELGLAAKFEADVRRVAGVIEIPVGEGRIGNTPVGTILSYIESVSQVPGAVHKDDHITQGEEYELLRQLFAEEPEALWRGNRSPARRWQVAQEIMDPDLVPAADPNTSSSVHRLMKVQGLVTVGGMPQFNGIADNRRIYAAAVGVLTGSDATEYMLPPPPPGSQPPDPHIVAAMAKQQAEQQKLQVQMAKMQSDHDAKMAELAQQGATRAADRTSEETRAAMTLEGAKVKAAADIAKADADRTHEALQSQHDRAHDVGMKAVDRATAQFSAPLTAPEGDGAQ